MNPEEARGKIQKLLVTGDNRLKQGVDQAKARASYEQALEVARQAGLEESVSRLVAIRLADLDAADAASGSHERTPRARESPPDAPPAA